MGGFVAPARGPAQGGLRCFSHLSRQRSGRSRKKSRGCRRTTDLVDGASPIERDDGPQLPRLQHRVQPVDLRPVRIFWTSGPSITAGWHALVRMSDGRKIRQYVDGLRTVAVTATGSWTIYRWGWQFTGSEGLDEAYVPFLGAFGAAWDDAMVARWNANPLGMLWPEMDAAFVTSGGGNGGPPTATRRPVVIIAAG